MEGVQKQLNASDSWYILWSIHQEVWMEDFVQGCAMQTFRCWLSLYLFFAVFATLLYTNFSPKLGAFKGNWVHWSSLKTHPSLYLNCRKCTQKRWHIPYTLKIEEYTSISSCETMKLLSSLSWFKCGKQTYIVHYFKFSTFCYAQDLWLK